MFRWAYFHNGNVEVHVVRETEPGRLTRTSPGWDSEELRTGLCHHFAVLVGSFEPFLAAMREGGLERVGGPRVRDDYVEQIYIADPDGHIIELLSAHAGIGPCPADRDLRSGHRGACGPGTPRTGSAGQIRAALRR